MIKRSFVFIFIALFITRAGAQNNGLEPALQALLEKAIQLNIVARVLPPDEQPVWNMKSSKVTLPGRSVAVKLVGRNLQIDIVFTPYQNENGGLVLVAQGQVWLSEAPEKTTRYVSTFKSIPISLGEKILFFPLGFSGDISNGEFFTIEIEVEVLSYKELEKSSE